MRRVGRFGRGLLGALAPFLLSAMAKAQPADPTAAGLAFLASRQNLNGTWGGIVELSPRDTSRVLISHSLLRVTTGGTGNGLAWLAGQHAFSPNQFLAEQAIALSRAGLDNAAVLDRLIRQRSSIGQDFGGFVDHKGNNLDSALALQAFSTREATYAATISSLATTLLSRQNPDGGWGFDEGFASHPFFSGEVLIALTSTKAPQVPASAIANGHQYLAALLQPSGQVGDGVLSSALTYRALAFSGFSVASLAASPLQYLASQQGPDGSWGFGDIYLTARVLEAFGSRKANLVIAPGGFTVSPTTVVDGGSVTATIIVSNYGPIGSSATSVTAYVGDTSGRNLGSASVSALAPGASTTVTIAFTAGPPVGLQTLLAVVDPPGTLDELRKDDNRATTVLVLKGKPDLQIFSNDIATEPARLQPGSPGQVRVTIHNNGQGDVAATDYLVQLTSGSSTTTLGSGTISGIPGGGSQVISLPATLQAGSYTVSAIADPSNLIVELDEGNNRASRPIAVSTVANVDLRVPPGGLTVTPPRPAAGEVISISVVVENLGADPVQSFLRIYDGVPGAGGSVVGTFPVSLDAGAQQVVQASHTTTAASRVISAVADPDGAIPEIDESNNSALIALTDQLVDLALTRDGLVLPRVSPAAGQSVTGRLVVWNLGALAATNRVRFYDDLPQNGGQTVADVLVTVAAGGKTVVSASWTARAGQRFATAEVNADRSIPEPDYSNNRVTKFYGVSGSGPDIWVNTARRDDPFLSLDASGLVVSSTNLTVSGSVRVTVQMAGVAQSFAVTLFEDRDGDGAFNPEADNPLGSAILQPGPNPQVVQLTAVGSVRFAPGRLALSLDSGNSVVESNESNNSVDLRVNCEVGIPFYAPWPGDTKWSTPGLRSNVLVPVARVVDTNGDDVMDENDIPTVMQMSFGTLYARRGDTGTVHWSVSGLSQGAISAAIGDVDGDGRAETIVHAPEHRLVCVGHDGQIKWTSPELDLDPKWPYYIGISFGFVKYSHIGAPTIADLDGDGHPEVISGRSVLDGATGAVEWVGTAGRGRAWDTRNDDLYWQSFPDQEVPIAVDLDGDGKLEVVAGNTAYRHDGTIYWHRSDLPDGYTAPFLIRGQSRPQVCLVAEGKVYLLNFDGTTKWGPVPIPGGALLGGAPTPFYAGGQFIGVAGDGWYSVLDSSNAQVRWSVQVSAPAPFNTATNSATIFNFASDGDNALGLLLVYQSIDKLNIIRGDGHVFYQEPNQVFPYHPGGPTVADVDNDGRADLIVQGREGGGGIRVRGSPYWNAAPAVFNQAAYHIINVSETGAIPPLEVETAFSREHYRTQLRLPTPPQPLPNLTVSYVRVDSRNYPASVKITGRVGNAGWTGARAGFPVSFFLGNPSAGGQRIATVPTASAIPSAGYEDVAFVLNNPPAGPQVFYVVADRDPAGAGTVTECIETDNTGVGSSTNLALDVATLPGSLVASDVFPRPGDVITLAASARATGAVDTSRLFAQFFLGDPDFGGTAISPVLPVQASVVQAVVTASLTFDWTVAAPSGSQTIFCVFDPQNLIVEESESNNRAAVSIQVSTAAEIKKISATTTLTPPAAEPGHAVSVAALLENMGNVPLAGVEIRYEARFSAGAVASTGSATLTSLAKFARAELALGSFTPAVEDTYTVTLFTTDPTVTLLASPKTIRIGVFIGAELTAAPARVPIALPLVQSHLRISRLNTVVLPDDPLRAVILQALQKGLNWEAPAVLSASADGCFKCHVQSQGLAGLEASRRVAGVTVDDSATQQIFDQMVSFQSGGSFHWQGLRISAVLGAWALSYWHDPLEAKPHLLESLDFLVGQQDPDGSFMCDNCQISFGNREATTMMSMIAFTRGLEMTGDSRYRAALTGAANWAVAYDYRSRGIAEPEFAARVAIGLASALPQVTDPVLAENIRTRLQAIAAFLRSAQNPDGSFGTGTTPETPIIRSAQSLLALALAGARSDDPVLRAGILYLINRQQSNGGWFENRYELSNQTIWLDETTWAMISLPAAFLRLGQFDVDASVTIPSPAALQSPNPAPSITRAVSGGTEYVWRFTDVTEAGSDVYFNVLLNGLTAGETRPIAASASLKYVHPYSEDKVTHPIAVPSVTGYGPLRLDISTDRGAYGTGETVTITEVVTNIGTTNVGIAHDLVIRDASQAQVAVVAAAEPVTGLPISPFPGWRFAVPVTFTVASGGSGRLIAFPVDFAALLAQLGITSGFDANSIRVSSDASPSSEWYFAWKPAGTNPAVGTLTASVPDDVAAGAAVALHVYFDTLDNVPKPVSVFDRSRTGALAGNGLTATFWNLDRTVSVFTFNLPEKIVTQGPPVFQTTQPDGDWRTHAGAPTDSFTTTWAGFLDVPADGIYQFGLGSDDGSWLYLDGNLLIDNGGVHGFQEFTASVSLTAGVHPIRAVMFESGGYEYLRIRWAPPGQGLTVIPGSALRTAPAAASPSAVTLGTPAPLPDGTVTLTHTWSTGSTAAGAYSAVGTLRQNGAFVVSNSSAFTIGAVSAFGATLSTDRAAYDPNDTVHVSAAITHGGNTSVSGLVAVLTVRNPGGQTVASGNTNLPAIAPGQTLPANLDWPVGAAAPGIYQAALLLRDAAGATLLSRNAPFTVRSTTQTGSGLSGTLGSNSPVIHGRSLDFSISIVNGGNVDLTNAPFAIRLLDPATQALVAELPFTASIARGATHNALASLSTTSLSVQDYSAFLVSLLTGQPQALAGAPVTLFSVGGVALRFFTLTPCRVLDTRNPDGPLGGPALQANTDRTFVATGQCGVPSDAVYISANLVVTQPTDQGNLRIYPAGTLLPLVSTINYRPGQTRANNAIVLLGVEGAFSVRCEQATGSAHILLDVNGYFAVTPVGASQTEGVTP